MTKKKIVPPAALFLVLLAFAGAYAGDNKNRRLIFIGTADLQGRLDPVERSVNLDGTDAAISVVGGFARIASAIARVKQSAQAPVIVLSSGDDLMGRYFHYYDGKAIFSLMGKAGYDILGLGNHEFDRGPGVLGEALEQTDFTTLCTDLVTTGTALEHGCQPYLTRDYGNVRVGFFSLMTETFPYVTSGGNVKLQADNLSVARRMVALLNQQGADLVIAVTHIGADQDRKLAAQVKGIDIIFGGHSHEYLTEYERVGDTLIVNGGEKGAALVYLDVGLAADNTILEDGIRFRLIPVSKEIEEDKYVNELLVAYREKMPKAVVLGRTETTWNLGKSAVRAKESTVADLVNDLIRDKFAVDIVFNNAGAFRGNKEYPPGPVTDTMLHEIDEFENDVYLLKLKGSYLKEILEHSAIQVGGGGFLQVAGLRFIINTTAEAQEISEQNATWSISKVGKRVTDIKVAEKDGAFQRLDPEKTYSVACNAYLAEKSGDKYFWFKQYGLDPTNTYTTLYSLLAEEFDKQKILNTPESDGRITLKMVP